ncbi:hypothetical protein B0H66DRAFT_550898 [Apodospora peruviana]|uniref:Uncharacterized protein n=1 Tax=Apodospora peruviana TaxID=516989 RepID=A0AAE0MC97_9PEZI|nr:hypothetical protein B0H66DRAFT_550898 [Apodospora peruviana]
MAAPTAERSLTAAERAAASAAELAMLDDLGIARVNELPMEDDHDRHHHGRRQAPAGRSFTVPTRIRKPAACNPTTTHPKTNVANVWKAAIDSGVFDDEDAEAVKGLDDLGGGRLYDHRGSAEVVHPELHGPRASRFHNQGAEIPPGMSLNGNRGPRVSSLGIVQVGDEPIRGFPPRHVPLPGPVRAQSAQHTSKPGGNCPATKATQRLASQPNHPSSQIARPAHDVQLDYGDHEPVPYPKPANLVYEVPVMFTPPKRKPTPSRIFLCAAKEPDNGIFALVVLNIKYAEESLANWKDCQYVNLDFTVSFKNRKKAEKTYCIKFRREEDILAFQGAVWGLKEGEFAFRLSETEAQPANAFQVVTRRRATSSTTEENSQALVTSKKTGASQATAPRTVDSGRPRPINQAPPTVRPTPSPVRAAAAVPVQLPRNATPFRAVQWQGNLVTDFDAFFGVQPGPSHPASTPGQPKSVPAVIKPKEASTAEPLKPENASRKLPESIPKFSQESFSEQKPEKVSEVVKSEQLATKGTLQGTLKEAPSSKGIHKQITKETSAATLQRQCENLIRGASRQALSENGRFEKGRQTPLEKPDPQDRKPLPIPELTVEEPQPGMRVVGRPGLRPPPGFEAAEQRIVRPPPRFDVAEQRIAKDPLFATEQTIDVPRTDSEIRKLHDSHSSAHKKTSSVVEITKEFQSTKGAAPDGASSTEATKADTKRIQYTSKEMMVLREFAKPPPPYLTELRYLPPVHRENRNDRNTPTGWVHLQGRQTYVEGRPEMSQSQPNALTMEEQMQKIVASSRDYITPSPAPVTSHNPADLLRTESVATVDSVAISNSAMTSESNNTPTVSSTTRDRNMGLQGSLWAAEQDEVVNPNLFTGATYTHVWPTNSHLNDLLLLDIPTPEAEPTPVAPMPAGFGTSSAAVNVEVSEYAEMIQPQPQEALETIQPQPQRAQETIQQAVKGIETSVRKIQPPRPLGLRGLGASRHAVPAASVSRDGNFDFFRPAGVPGAAD